MEIPILPYKGQTGWSLSVEGYMEARLIRLQALTKFLKAVSWSDPREVRQVVELLPKWAEVDVDDAIEMLGPAFINATVRSYAVDRLRKSDDNVCPKNFHQRYRFIH